MNFDSEGSDVEFVAEWSPAVRNDKCINSKILLTHDYYQPIETAVNKLREETKATTKILGRIRKLESSPDVAKRKVGNITVVYLDENDKPKNVSVQLEKSDYDKAIVAHEKGLHVEIVGELKRINNRTSSMSCESFGIID